MIKEMPQLLLLDDIVYIVYTFEAVSSSLWFCISFTAKAWYYSEFNLLIFVYQEYFHNQEVLLCNSTFK